MTADKANPEGEDKQWHLDKKVPLPMLFAIAGQTIAFAWWAATTTARLDEVERKLVANAPQGERVIRLEEKVGVVQKTVDEIKAILAGRSR